MSLQSQRTRQAEGGVLQWMLAGGGLLVLLVASIGLALPLPHAHRSAAAPTVAATGQAPPVVAQAPQPSLPPCPQPPIPPDPSQPPAVGWEWLGKGTPGIEGGGAWYNRTTGESLRPAIQHHQGHGPHWDYQKERQGQPDYQRWRLYTDGRCEQKPTS